MEGWCAPSVIVWCARSGAQGKEVGESMSRHVQLKRADSGSVAWRANDVDMGGAKCGNVAHEVGKLCANGKVAQRVATWSVPYVQSILSGGMDGGELLLDLQR
jgi:hypothetical protein